MNNKKKYFPHLWLSDVEGIQGWVHLDSVGLACCLPLLDWKHTKDPAPNQGGHVPLVGVLADRVPFRRTGKVFALDSHRLAAGKQDSDVLLLLERICSCWGVNFIVHEVLFFRVGYSELSSTNELQPDELAGEGDEQVADQVPFRRSGKVGYLQSSLASVGGGPRRRRVAYRFRSYWTRCCSRWISG